MLINATGFVVSRKEFIENLKTNSLKINFKIIIINEKTNNSKGF
jgi:hypothetical protein